jgi:argininosuccinate lyase
MEDTGRIREPLDRRARALLFAETGEGAIRDEVVFFAQIDRAHIVMLAEREILPRGHARRLLGAIDDLIARDYAPLHGRAAPRGSYLVYEHWLIETLGERVGGAAHIGRSRNDINATVLRLRLRPVHRRLAGELLRLIATLTRRAERYATLTMPIYTHHQAALPITFGHYLAGVALALHRDLRGLDDAVRDLDRCPLGAGAAGGTALPIDGERTARLLGFTEGVLHSVDAVASRDLVLRLLAAAGVLGITLSRIAADLQLWSTAEFDMIAFPDTLVGSSSMMPQKRNAFLLEHIKARGAAPLGGFTAAAMAMHATPFSNSIAVGTEAVRHLWSALDDVAGAIVLSRLVVAGAQPRLERMRRRALDSFTSATELANQLVMEQGLSFRQAHFQVGAAVRAAIERGEAVEEAATPLPLPLTRQDLADARLLPDPAVVASRAAFGGGPGRRSLERVLSELRRQSSAARSALGERARRWRSARRALEAAVDDLSMKREASHA